jgi:hypothetical protein
MGNGLANLCLNGYAVKTIYRLDLRRDARSSHAAGAIVVQAERRPPAAYHRGPDDAVPHHSCRVLTAMLPAPFHGATAAS